ncbi:MAG: DUF3343 domain-containing protein [Chloroflexota bacterium]
MYNGVVTFPSSFFALRSEKIAQRADYNCKLIPCPRELSSSCAVSLAFDGALVAEMAQLITQKRIKYEAIYLYKDSHVGDESNGQKEIVTWRG